MDEYNEYSKETTPVEDLPGMHIQLDGQVIYYEKTGEGSPVILLHGNGEDHSIFDELIDEMKSEHTFYALDSRGCGHSATPAEYHYKDMADDVVNFIKALSIEKPYILGFSDGAITALLVGIDHSELLSGIVSCGANLSPKGLRWSARHMIKKLYRQTNDPMIGMMMKEPDINPTMLEFIQVPTLVMAGSKDMITEVETKRISLSIPKALLKILKKEDHTSYVVHSTKLAPHLREFMSDEEV